MSELVLNGQMLARVEIDTQISTAKMYPRQSLDKFISEAIAMVTIDEETAESCIYSLPRTSTDKKTGEKTNTFIKGESIRLAEVVANAWGNMHCGTRIIENDGKTVTAEGAAWDLEKNVKISKYVQKSITYANGGGYSKDMQIVTANAACSVALRNAILSVIPRAAIKKVYNAAVSFAIGDQKKLSTKVEAVLARFQKLGIQREKIMDYFDKKSVSDFTAEDVEEMFGIGTAIKEGNLLIEKAFVVEPDGLMAKTIELDNKLDKKAPSMSHHKDFVTEMDKAKTL